MAVDETSLLTGAGNINGDLKFEISTQVPGIASAGT
jgi:hypothetical protein